jgi:hypothetical protein
MHGIIPGCELDGFSLQFVPTKSRERYKVRRYFKKHRTKVLVVGAVIIFATYVLKEVVADRYKDVATSVDSAQSLFIVCETVRPSPNLFARLAEISKEHPKSVEAEISRLIASEENYIEGSLDTTKRLVESLSDQDDLLKRVTALQLKHYNEEIDAKGAETLAVDETIIHPKKGRAVDAEALALSFDMKYFPQVVATSVATKKLADEALDIAERKKAKAEWLYGLAKWCSFGLYGFGWALGVIGVIYGIGGVSE